MTEHYLLGNILRGFVEGYFNSEEKAWSELCDAFNKMFPSENGRGVFMYKEVPVKEGNSKKPFIE